MMHFMEKLFGISPDGDTGFTELLIFAVPALAYLIVWWVRRRRGALE